MLLWFSSHHSKFVENKMVVGKVLLHPFALTTFIGTVHCTIFIWYP